MKRVILSLILILSLLTGYTQATCSVTTAPNCPDTSTYLYAVIPSTFVQKYLHYKSGVNEFNAVQTNEGCWVTGAGALDEFPNLFKEYNQDKLNTQIVRLNTCNFNSGGSLTQMSTPTNKQSAYMIDREKQRKRLQWPKAAIAVMGFVGLMMFSGMSSNSKF